MNAEVISIGDELTSGQRLDTNSQWLSQQLSDLGIRVEYHTTVADALDANIQVFRQAVDRADVVIATGGLGPTADDLTRDALAAVSGCELVLDEASLAHIQQLFARHKRDMPERNRVQAMFPTGSQVIFNPKGTAPGIWLTQPRPGRTPCHVFALPGVPAEMFEMYRQTVTPALQGLLPEPRLIRHHRIKCFGVGESHLEQMLPDMIRRGRTPSVGITVHEATITLRITAEGRTADECRQQMEPTIATIRDCLGTLVFGEEDDELEHSVMRLLAARDETLGTIEWGTRGLLARWLSEAGGVGGPFIGGIVAGAHDPLGFAAAGLVEAVPASEEFARNAAALCRERMKVDYAISIGPFPKEQSPTSDPPPFYFALATPDTVLVRSSTLASHPAIWKPRAAKQALNLLRLTLL